MRRTRWLSVMLVLLSTSAVAAKFVDAPGSPASAPGGVPVSAARRTVDTTSPSTTAPATTVAPTTTTTTTTPPPPPEPIAEGIQLPDDSGVHRATTYRYGDAEHQLLDVFVPSTDQLGTPPPVIVYFHAGGWVAGARTDIPELISAQVARGWAVVSVDYVLAPTDHFPAPVLDADLAVRWVRHNAAALGLRGDVLVAAGASAGGHIAAWLAADAEQFRAQDESLADVDSGVDAAVLLVAPVVMADLRNHGDSMAPAILAAYLGCPNGRAERCPDELLRRSDPSLHVGSSPAPLFAVHGRLDATFPPRVHGQALADAWRSVGGWAQVTVSAKGGHDLDPVNTDLAPMETFLDAVASR